MPRVRNPMFRRRGRARVNWERSSGGRLLRLDNPAHYMDSDILIYNIDHVNAIAVAQHTTEQRVPPLPPLIESAQSNEVFNFEKLERHNALRPILDFLGVSDIEALSKVSSFFSNHIDHNYLLRLSLPLPPGMLRKLANRKVLALTSCCNLAWLPGIHTFQPFDQLNLTNIRELKLIGKNLDLRYMNTHQLSQDYHKSLQHILKCLSRSNISKLKRLEILTDSTSRSVDTALVMKKLVSLEELVLHGIGHFNNSAAYEVDVDTANLIIGNALLNKNISVLHLVKYDVRILAKSSIVIHSDSLEQLSILDCKVIKLDLKLPSLTSLETDISTYVFDHFVDEQMKQMVETNCPLLRTWNGVDVKEVAKKADSSSWAEHLTFPEPLFTN